MVSGATCLAPLSSTGTPFPYRAEPAPVIPGLAALVSEWRAAFCCSSSASAVGRTRRGSTGLGRRAPDGDSRSLTSLGTVVGSRLPASWSEQHEFGIGQV